MRLREMQRGKDKGRLSFYHGKRMKLGNNAGEPCSLYHGDHCVNVFVGFGSFLRKSAEGFCSDDYAFRREPFEHLPSALTFFGGFSGKQPSRPV